MKSINTAKRYQHIRNSDPELFQLIVKQEAYESSTLKMIPSENFAPYPVLEASGSTLTNKYSEGYPGARYYEGNEIMDEIENLAIKRAKQVFGVEHANVQPFSGAPANHAVYRALLSPGDKVMGMSVPQGGHLTHGWKVNFSGKDYVPVHYGVDPKTGMFDYNQIRDLALRERPKMIWVGATAYPRILDYEKFAKIADEVKAYLVADIAHINALIIAGLHPNPVPYCDVVTTTTHKILRGPRAGIVMCKVKDRYHDLYHSESKLTLAARVDRAVFPQLQAGPHMNTIAAIATALKEATTPEFKRYAHQVVQNAKRLAEELLTRGYKLVTGGTDNHLLVIDFRDSNFSGKDYAKALARAGIICNFNMVPGDSRTPLITSGVRMGTPALTSMGMKENDMSEVADLIDRVCKNVGNVETIEKIRKQVAAFCSRFSVPGIRE
jgi:glycine hydroxymethyltransferase